MSENTQTRTEVVTANMEAIIEKYGENTSQFQTQCLKDINLSLAALVDAGTTSET